MSALRVNNTPAAARGLKTMICQDRLGTNQNTRKQLRENGSRFVYLTVVVAIGCVASVDVIGKVVLARRNHLQVLWVFLPLRFKIQNHPPFSCRFLAFVQSLSGQNNRRFRMKTKNSARRVSFYIKMIILPRQARDKHRENSKKATHLAFAPPAGRGQNSQRSAR